MEDNGQQWEDNQVSFHKVYQNKEDAERDISGFNNRIYVKPTHEEWKEQCIGPDDMSYEEFCVYDQLQWEYHEEPRTRSIIETELL